MRVRAQVCARESTKSAHSPLAKSSEISKSRSFADMDKYKAVTDKRLDCRKDRVSWEDMVF